MTRDWFQYFQNLHISNLPKFLYDYYTFRGPTLGHIITHVPVGGRIIEFGSGSGLMGILLSSLGYRVLGVDSNPEVVNLAEANNSRLGGHAVFICSNLFDIAAEKADLCMSEGVIEHYRAEILFDAMRAHIRAGIKQLFIVPTHEDPLLQDQDAYSFKELRRVCSKVGLRIIDQYAQGFSIVKWRQQLLPPYLFTKLANNGFVPCENVGVICENKFT